MGRVDGGVERLAAAFARDGSRRRSNFFFTSISPNKSFALVAAFPADESKISSSLHGEEKNETSLCTRRQREALFSRFRLSSYLCNPPPPLSIPSERKFRASRQFDAIFPLLSTNFPKP